jgi:short-subunit dehydrogenase
MHGRAVVTGAGGGLGSAFCRGLAARGWDVVPVDVQGTERVLDVTDPDACRALARDVQPALWINNAGVLGAGSAADQSDAEIARVVGVNLLGVINGTRAAVEVMRPRGAGRILNVGSLASWLPVPGEAVYCATKHGVRAFSLALAVELHGTGIRISVLCPDGIATPMLRDKQADAGAAMSFTAPRLLEADAVAARGIAMIEGDELIASFPAFRGFMTKMVGVFPRVGETILRRLEAQGRRTQARLRAQGVRVGVDGRS